MHTSDPSAQEMEGKKNKYSNLRDEPPAVEGWRGPLNGDFSEEENVAL